MTFSLHGDVKEISIPTTSSIMDALQSIDQGAIGLSLLVDEKSSKFCGLVTDGDIRRALLSGFGLNSPINSIPRPDTISISIAASTEEISKLFSDKIRCIPILNDERQVTDLALYDKRVRLPVAEPSLKGNELQYVSECVLTGWVSSAGRFVNQFEEMFAEYCGSKYAIATSNGTTALHLALLACDIGPGDEVIVPTLTFIATANAVTYTGAKPVFIDSEQETWNMDANLISNLLNSKTKAIIPVHLYGHPTDMDPVLDIARRKGLKVIEDAAEAHGATYKGNRVGGIGDLGIFSFYGNKIITTGEGGMVVTNNKDYANKIRMLRDHGMSTKKRYWHPYIGYNYRMTNLQAALGVAQMERVDSIVDKKHKIAKAYSDGLKDIQGINLPPDANWAENIFWMYSILINQEEFGRTRDQVIDILKEKLVDSRPFFTPIHNQPIYKLNKSFPIAESLSLRGINLPSAVTLTISDIDYIISTIKQISIDS